MGCFANFRSFDLVTFYCKFRTHDLYANSFCFFFFFIFGLVNISFPLVFGQRMKNALGRAHGFGHDIYLMCDLHDLYRSSSDDRSRAF